MKGGGGLMDVDQSVQVCLPIASGAEERILEGWNIYSSSAIQSAVAANFSACNIRNPLGSNVVVVIEKITSATSVAAQMDLAVASSPNGADLAGAVPGRPRVDTRIVSGNVSVVTRDAPATDPETGYLVAASTFQLANTPYDWIVTAAQEMVLTPGVNLRVVNRLVNTNLYVTLFWRERAMEASELT